MNDACFVCSASEHCPQCSREMDCDSIVCDAVLRNETERARLEYRRAWIDYINEDYYFD